MNVEIGTEAAHFPEKEYISGIFLAVCAEGGGGVLKPVWNCVCVTVELIVLLTQ
jgi:hypothetical protein